MNYHFGGKRMILVIILEILIGALGGWLAGKLMKSKNKRFWINCLVGIVGSFLGGWIGGLLGIGGGILGFVMSIVGTCLLIVILRLILGKKF